MRLAAPAMPDGVVGMALEQLVESNLRRLDLARLKAHPCDHPPLWQGTVSNAYHLRPFGCVVILPGLLRRPFADMQYDDASLISRIGGIIAHELAHVLDLSWMSEKVDDIGLFQYHCKDSHEEAAADLLAALTVIHMLVQSGVADTEDAAAAVMSSHWAQLWCGMKRKKQKACTTHPIGNNRPDGLCDTLWRLGISCVAEKDL